MTKVLSFPSQRLPSLPVHRTPGQLHSSISATAPSQPFITGGGRGAPLHPHHVTAGSGNKTADVDSYNQKLAHRCVFFGPQNILKSGDFTQKSDYPASLKKLEFLATPGLHACRSPILWSRVEWWPEKRHLLPGSLQTLHSPLNSDKSPAWPPWNVSLVLLR